METEKWESGERPNDHVLGERWPPGAAEMSQATVSRAVADETQERSFAPLFTFLTSAIRSCRQGLPPDGSYEDRETGIGRNVTRS